MNDEEGLWVCFPVLSAEMAWRQAVGLSSHEHTQCPALGFKRLFATEESREKVNSRAGAGREMHPGAWDIFVPESNPRGMTGICQEDTRATTVQI